MSSLGKAALACLAGTATAMAGVGPAQANCGHARISAAGAPAGSAPLAVGDSVMIGAAKRLARAGFEVDAQCGRSPDGGLFVLRNHKRRGTLPESVVFALGTNWWVEATHIRKALRILGPHRKLFLVTPYRSWRAVSNTPMRAAARRKPHRVQLVDWSSRSYGNGHWFQGDGTHLRATGIRAYTRLLKRTVWKRQGAAFAT